LDNTFNISCIIDFRRIRSLQFFNRARYRARARPRSFEGVRRKRGRKTRTSTRTSDRLKWVWHGAATARGPKGSAPSVRCNCKARCSTGTFIAIVARSLVWPGWCPVNGVPGKKNGVALLPKWECRRSGGSLSRWSGGWSGGWSCFSPSINRSKNGRKSCEAVIRP
jgi:hypothetical protein